MKRRVDVDSMVPFGLRGQDHPPSPHPPPPPPWSPSSHHLLDMAASDSFVGMDMAVPSTASSRMLHHSLMSDFASQSSSSSSAFGYSQKNFHISDGTLYSILSPFQSRRSTSRPSFLRGHATVTTTTPLAKGERTCPGKAKLKFHHHEVPPSYRDCAKKPPLPTTSVIKGAIPNVRTHFEVLEPQHAGLFHEAFRDRPSPPVSNSASSSSVAGGSGMCGGSSASSNSSWLDSVFREEECPRRVSKHDEVIIVDSDGSAMDLSSGGGHHQKSFYSRQSSSSESESYSLSSMRSFKRDLFTAAASASGSSAFAGREEEDDDDDDDDTPLNLCLADLRRARPSATETSSPGMNIKREIYFDDEDDDDSEDDSDDEEGSFGQLSQDKRRFSVPDLLLSDSFLDVRQRLRDPHSPSESGRTQDDVRPPRPKRHLNTSPPLVPSKSDITTNINGPFTMPAAGREDDDGKPCVKTPRISEMLQNMTLLDCRTHLERYAAIRERLMATHPEMFVNQCPSSTLLEDLDHSKGPVATAYWTEVPLPASVEYEKQPIPLATTRSADYLPGMPPVYPVPMDSSGSSTKSAPPSPKIKEPKDTNQGLPFLRTRHRLNSPTPSASKPTPGPSGKGHQVRHRKPPPSPTMSDRCSYSNNDINICKFKLIKGSQPVLEEKKSFFVPVPRTSSSGSCSRVNEGASTSAMPSSCPQTPPSPDSFRTYKIHVGSQEDMGRKLATGGATSGNSAGGGSGGKRLRRRSRKALVREKLEATFREQGFLIKTQQVSSAEGAVYCKFRQLRKFTRYLYKSWRDYLPKDLDELNESGGLSRNQSF